MSVECTFSFLFTSVRSSSKSSFEQYLFLSFASSSNSSDPDEETIIYLSTGSRFKGTVALGIGITTLELYLDTGLTQLRGFFSWIGIITLELYLNTGLTRLRCFCSGIGITTLELYLNTGLTQLRGFCSVGHGFPLYISYWLFACKTNFFDDSFYLLMIALISPVSLIWFNSVNTAKFVVVLTFSLTGDSRDVRCLDISFTCDCLSFGVCFAGGLFFKGLCCLLLTRDRASKKLVW